MKHSLEHRLDRSFHRVKSPINQSSHTKGQDKHKRHNHNRPERNPDATVSVQVGFRLIGPGGWKSLNVQWLELNPYGHKQEGDIDTGPETAGTLWAGDLRQMPSGVW